MLRAGVVIETTPLGTFWQFSQVIAILRHMKTRRNLVITRLLAVVVVHAELGEEPVAQGGEPGVMAAVVPW